jgi:flagellar motor switch protein FliG
MSGKMSGPQKAATFMLAVGEEHASKLFAMMHEDEIRDISQAMASLGTVSAVAVEDLARIRGDHRPDG